MPLGVSIPVKEVRRYWGYYGPVTDPEADTLISEAIGHYEKESEPRSVYRTFPVSVEDDLIHIGDDVLESKALARNLKGCSEAVLFAATIGPACDRLVKRAEIKSSALAACYQATGAAAVEAYCDMLNDKITEEARSRGLYSRPRFSPGYGDLNIESQKIWFRLLDITKKTGISLTDSYLMVPTKSVTAIIGLSSNDLPCIRQGCESCNMSSTCEFSRERNSHDS